MFSFLSLIWITLSNNPEVSFDWKFCFRLHIQSVYVYTNESRTWKLGRGLLHYSFHFSTTKTMLWRKLWMLRVCKLLCTVTCPHESNKTLLGKLKWTVSLSAFYIVKSIFHNTKVLLRRKLPGERDFLYQNYSIRNTHTLKEK